MSNHSKPRALRARVRRNRGAILIATIIISFVLASMVIVLTRSMAVEAIASANSAAAIQAGAVERGAEQYVLGIVADTTQAPLDLDEQTFEAIQVGDGYFWIVRPDYGDSSLPQFGLVDEGGKFDINSSFTTAYQAMMNLPGMTTEVAAAVIDWRDSDDTIEPHGGSENYNDYTCKNSNFETVEELLLVRGVTPQLLYGDGTAPPLGATSSSVPRAMGTVPGANDVQLAHGLFDYLTVNNVQPNTAADGTTRTNITGQNGRRDLRRLLTTKLSSKVNQIMTNLGTGPLTDIFQLKQVMSDADFDLIADYITNTNATTVRGRINVLSAPRDVLLSLDTLTSVDVDKLIASRSGQTPGAYSWIGTALATKAIGLGSRVTTRPSRYSADIIAVSGNGRAFKHVRIVVDPGTATAGATPTPKIVYRRDLTNRGWPMDPQILASIRAGNPPASNGIGGMSR